MKNYIVCIIDIFSLNLTVMVCNEDSEVRITLTCLLGNLPELAINMANEYETNEVILSGNLNYAGLLSVQMYSMNPLLNIKIK